MSDTGERETVALRRSGAPTTPAVPSDGASPTHVGPFQLLEVLGQGGNGTVHRAVHRESGEVVAVKTVRRPHAGELSFLRREIQSLARLRHPGIVRILAHGIDGGMPWYAMELVDGAGWRRHLPAAVADSSELETSAPAADAATTDPGVWWTETIAGLRDDARAGAAGPSPLPPAPPADLPSRLELLRRLCAPLAYIHGEGIVHRDLKPENVLVRRDGTPVIVDFGLVEQTGSRESLDATARVAGTILYMAPEQGQGRLVDARADLYALGCMAFELLTGRPPFVAANAMAVFRMHQKAEPRPPSHLVPGIPRELDELVLRLLAKEPRARYGYAADVAAALERLGAAASPAPPEPPSRSYVYRASLAGRSTILAHAGEALAAAPTTHGAVLLIEGPEGSGKTRLLSEVAANAAARSVQVLAGACLPSDPPRLLEAFRGPLQAMADGCRERGAAATRRILGAGAELLKRYEPAFTDLPGLDGGMAPAELGFASARLRLFSAVAGSLRAFADGPMLLVLDDLQWADELSLEILLFLARTADRASTPLTIVATHRAEDPPPALLRLRAAPGVKALTLDPLDRAEVGRIVADMLAMEAPPDPLVDLLAEAAGGSPLYVAEYLRLAVDERLLVRGPDGCFALSAEAGSRLPRSLPDLIRQRLALLPADARRVLALAAILAPRIEEPLLAALGTLGEAAVDASIETLLARQLLTAGSGGRLGFANDLVRHVAGEVLDAGDRMALHRKAAELLQESGAADEEVAHHWERCGEADRAAALLLAAARRSLSRHAVAESERCYRRALASMPARSAERARARQALGADVLWRRGKSREALAELDGALEDAIALGDEELRVACLDAQARILRDGGDSLRARALMEEGLTRARALGARGLEGRILSSLGSLDLHLGDHDGAARHTEAALAIHAEDGDVGSEGGAWGLLGNIRLTQSRIDDAQRCLERARQLAIEAGDRRNEGSWTANLGNVAYARGRLDEAGRYWEQGLAIAREVGDRHNEGAIVGNLAIIHEKRLELDIARHLHEESLQIAREIGEPEGVIHRLLNMGAALQELGDLSKARELFGQVVARSQELCERRLRGVAHSNLGSLLLEMGLPDDARAALDVAMAIHREIGDRALEGITLSRYGDELLARGCREEGRALLRQGLQISHDVGDGKQEGIVHLTLSIAAREDRQLGTALDHLTRAEQLLEAAESPMGMALCLVERAHHDLLAGRDAGEMLARAEAMVARGFAPQSRLARAVQRLRQAAGLST